MPDARPDFRLYHGNDLELLAGILARQLADPAPGQGLLAPDTILIPQPAMRRWLQKHLAETHGIAANLEFLAPGEFVARALKANLPGADDAAVGEAAVLRWRLWSLLSDPALLREPVFAPLAPLLARDDDPLPAWTLAGELAAAFEKYQAWRRDWLRGWDRGGDRHDWQAELWRRATRGLSHRGRRLDAYLSRFDGDAAAVPQGLPPRVFAFACQNVSPDVLRVIASSARAGILHFFFLSPVAGWWGDLRTARERLHADPEAVFAEDNENPLLRANGAAGRDFVRTLFSYEVVHPTFEKDLYVPPDPQHRRGLLHVLQRDLLARRPAPRDAQARRPFDDAVRADPSLQVHACHTRLREVQVLHDQLRALLDADPSLQAREIAVLAPDIDAYAPFVHAVFGGEAGRDAIPFAISDGSAIASQPAAEAYARLLALPGSRFGVNEVLDLLEAPAIAERFALEEADFDALRGWLGLAGVRWGLNAEHRLELDAPAEAAFSWAWALDRLLLGHAAGSDADIAGIAPLPLLEGGALATLDRLLQALRRLAHWQRALAQPRTPAGWTQALTQLVDDFFPARIRDLRERRTIDGLRALADRFATQAAQADVEALVPAAVVRAWWQATLAEDDARQPFLTGGVTFGRMVPMRLVPFKVICLLGMNDGEFPRRDPPGSLNRLAAQLHGPQRQPGDRSVRDDDRALFLQLFAAASDVFYLSYLGQDPRSGESRPPSVVVAELLEVASRYVDDGAAWLASMPVRHPLQPFSPAALGGDGGDGADPRRFSYQRSWAEAALRSAGARTTPAAFARGLPIVDVEEAPMLWTRDRLVRALANPAREFLAARLGLHLPGNDARLPEEEPFDAHDGLDRYQLDARLLDACLADPSVTAPALAQRMLAEGRIAPGAAGTLALQESLQRLAPALLAWRGAEPGPARTLPYALELDGARLDGVLRRVHGQDLRQFSASKGHGKTVLALGVDALVWSALGQTGMIERVVRGADLQAIAPIPVARARAKLRALIELAARAQREPLPFMPRTGLALLSFDDPVKALREARNCWQGEHGEGSDLWLQLALRGAMPFAGAREATAGFVALAEQVFAGLPGLSLAAPLPLLETADG